METLRGLRLQSGKTVKAIAVKADMINSAVATVAVAS